MRRCRSPERLSPQDLERIQGGGSAPAGSMSPIREGLVDYLARAAKFEACLDQFKGRHPFFSWRCRGILNPS